MKTWLNLSKINILWGLFIQHIKKNINGYESLKNIFQANITAIHILEELKCCKFNDNF